MGNCLEGLCCRSNKGPSEDAMLPLTGAFQDQGLARESPMGPSTLYDDVCTNSTMAKSRVYMQGLRQRSSGSGNEEFRDQRARWLDWARGKDVNRYVKDPYSM